MPTTPGGAGDILVSAALDLHLTTAEQLAVAASSVLAERARKARGDYNDFAHFTMRDEKGNAITQESLHRVIQLHVDVCWAAGLHAAVLAPFGHGKTIQTSVGRVCWEIGRDPTLRWKIVCNNDTKAQERVMGCSALIFSPAYRLVFPQIRLVPPEKARKQRKQAKATQHELFLDRPGFALDATIQAAGVLSGGTGGRADRMIFDDIVDQKNAIDEPTMREKVIANMENVWLQRLVGDGLAAYIGTAWHQADATHKLMDNPGWSVLVCAISEDFKRIDMEVYNPPEGYPLPRYAGSATEAAARGWVDVASSNVGSIRYDQQGQRLDVVFRSGGAYSYFGVPRSLYEALLAAESVGSYLNQNVKGIFRCERMPRKNGSAEGLVLRTGEVKRFNGRANR